MVDNKESREIVQTIISLARSLKLDTVAEGVETVQQEQLLVEMGCTHAQGFLYSQPVWEFDLPAVVERMNAQAHPASLAANPES